MIYFLIFNFRLSIIGDLRRRRHRRPAIAKETKQRLVAGRDRRRQRETRWQRIQQRQRRRRRRRRSTVRGVLRSGDGARARSRRRRAHRERRRNQRRPIGDEAQRQTATADFVDDRIDIDGERECKVAANVCTAQRARDVSRRDDGARTRRQLGPGSLTFFMYFDATQLSALIRANETKRRYERRERLCRRRAIR